MATIYEQDRSAESLISAANGDRSFENVNVDATGVELEAGAVLGKVTASGDYVAYAEGASDGSETVAGVLLEKVIEDETGARAIIARDATVKTYKLNYTGTEATVIAGLAALGIIAR